MDLKDYETLRTPLADEFPTRPRASQEIAAAKRSRTSTTTATPIRAGAIAISRQHVRAIAAGVLILAMISLATWQLGQTTRQPLQLTPAPTERSAFAAAPTAPPEAPTPTEQAAEMINVYDAPNGAIIGPIETTRRITPIAHAGAAWVQADVEDSGRVWIRTADLPGITIRGPDLAQPATPAPQTGQGLPGGDWTPPQQPGEPGGQPTATPAPAPTEAVVRATSAPAAPGDFEKPSADSTCKFTGCLPTSDMAQQAGREQACHALFWQYGDVDPEDPNVPEAEMNAIRACIWEGLYK